jgi:serine/threonine protein phosphatase PrpC
VLLLLCSGAPQDDAVVIEHFGGLAHQTFAGVFDGHGPYGRHAAKFASTRLPQLLAAKLAAGGSERRRTRAMREAFLEVHAGMRDAAGAGFDASLSGTTACCALLVGSRVLVASSGDSRCVVARQGAGGDLEVVPLTWDAKPSLPDEEQRILSHGACVVVCMRVCVCVCS